MPGGWHTATMVFTVSYCAVHSLPCAAHGKVFAVCFGHFAVCLRHTAKLLSPVVATGGGTAGGIFGIFETTPIYSY